MEEINNILVVGGAGYLGGMVVDFLLTRMTSNNNTKIIVYDNLLYEDSYRKEGVEFVFGDIRDKDKLLVLLKKASVVIWLAALVGDGVCQINPALSQEINTETVNWLSKNYKGRIIFTSTCSVYGAQDKLLTEAAKTNPLSVYAKTKLDAENYLINKNALIFRLGTLFGVGDSFSRIRLDLVINLLTVQACTQNKITIFGGNQYRPILHVKDAARAIVHSIYTNHTGVYNLSYKNIKIADLGGIFKKEFKNLEINTTSVPFQDARNYKVSNEKLVNDFGFTFLYNEKDGINELRELVESKRIKDFASKRYSNEQYFAETLYGKIS